MSYHLFSMTERTAKKRHRCIWCGQGIEPGTRYHDERSAYDGRIQKHRWHPECRTASDEHFRTEGEEFDAYDNERPTPTPADP